MRDRAPRSSGCILLAVACACEPRPDALSGDVPFLSSEGTVLSPCAPPRRVVLGCAVDGDTFDVDGCDAGERVRLLGVDAPELAHDGAPAECHADVATDALTALHGALVTLSFDARCTDPFGRTLAWVWVDPQALPAWLVEETHRLHDDPDDAAVLLSSAWLVAGLAPRYAPERAEPSRWDAVLAAAEADARRAGRGVWSCASPPDPSP